MSQPYPLKKRLSWRLEYWGYLLMESLLRPLPLELIDRIGCGIGFLLYYLSPSYRQLLIRNLRIAYGKELSLTNITQLARQNFQRTIANFLGTLKTTILPSAEINQHITLVGVTELNASLNQGTGAILILGHMGNWEILNRLHQYLPKKIHAGGIYQPLKNPLVNAHLLQQREQDGSQLFSKRDGFHAPATFLKNGGLLIVVGDQKVGRHGEAVPFFNRLSSLSPLPSILARKANVPVFTAGIGTLDAGHWQVTIKPLGKNPRTATSAQALESLIRHSPADYLWLHNRWKVSPTIPLAIHCRTVSPLNKESTTPLRLLLLSSRPFSPPSAHLLDETERKRFPLQMETLIIKEETSPRALATQIEKIDHSQPHPIEVIFILDDSPLLREAAQKTSVPLVKIKPRELSLLEFLIQQSSS